MAKRYGKTKKDTKIKVSNAPTCAKCKTPMEMSLHGGPVSGSGHYKARWRCPKCGRTR